MSSVTAAYRKDLERTKRTAFGPHDDAWLIVGSLLEAAADASAAGRKRLVSRAARVARQTISEAGLEQAARSEYGARLTNADAFAVLCISIEERGALELAYAVVELAIRAADPRPLSRGRLLAQKARTSNKFGLTEVAESLYVEMDRIARQENLPELHLRSLVGRFTVAQIAGNYPRVLTLARQAVELSKTVPLPYLHRRARNAAVMAAAKRSLFDEALEHAWAQIEASRGDPGSEVGALQTMGQLMLEIGNVEAARAAFSAVVARSARPMVMLPALSGLAIAAARTNDMRVLEWAVGEVANAKHHGAGTWPVTDAIIECAVALAIAGRTSDARALAKRGLELAEANGFNELVFRAEGVEQIAAQPTAEPVRLKASGSEIVRAVCELAPDRLPRHVRMTAGAAT